MLKLIGLRPDRAAPLVNPDQNPLVVKVLNVDDIKVSRWPGLRVPIVYSRGPRPMGDVVER